VVFCPGRGDEEHALSLPRAQKFVEETVEQVRNYLGLSMTVAEITMRDGLTDFAAECNRL